jgi:hypothetical protein
VSRYAIFELGAPASHFHRHVEIDLVFARFDQVFAALQRADDDWRRIAGDHLVSGILGTQFRSGPIRARAEAQRAGRRKNHEDAPPRIFSEIDSDVIAHGHLKRIPRGER